MVIRLISLALVLLVAACSSNDVRKAMGVKKEAPDEFLVLTRPELVLPPSFNLPTPVKQQERFDRDGTRNDARALLTGADHNASTVETGVASSGSADSVLLHRAGTAKSDPEIRSKIADDYAKVLEEKEKEKGELLGLKGALMPILPKQEEDTQHVLDPEEEVKRLREEKQQQIQQQL